MNKKLELQKELKKLEQELINPQQTTKEKEKIKHWKGLLEKDLKDYE